MVFASARPADREPSGDDASTLRAAGLNVTRPRLATLAELRAHPHATAGDVVAGVRHRLGKVSRQAVYDVLNALVDRDLARRFQPAGLPARYEVLTAEQHDHAHAVCRHCERIIDIAQPRIAPSPVGSDDAAGFVVDEIDVTYWGTCPDCRASAFAATSTTD